MCKSTGWVGQVLGKPVLLFTEHEYEERCRMFNSKDGSLVAGCVYLGTPHAINPAKGLRPPPEKSLILAHDLGYSNTRLHLPGTGPVRFLFGADTDEKTYPLPPMRPIAVSSALSSFARATVDRMGSCKWVLGMEIEEDGKSQWDRRP
ncbi:hypothetical protein F4801DRAFT_405720 [Xylaria longipes]|nr:hypothetical protein F4801DRAFT_405720 [Xylaria longipes]